MSNSEHPAIDRLLEECVSSDIDTRDANKEISDLISDLARATSEHRARLDAERIDRLVAELSTAWERVGALGKEVDGYRCKLVEHGLLCDGNHRPPKCEDPECWHHSPPQVGHTWPNPAAVALADACLRCGVTLAEFSRAPDECTGEQECTGVAASWCPNHGDCTCPRDPDTGAPEERHNEVMHDDNCPLHGEESSHLGELVVAPPTKQCTCTKEGARVVTYDPACEIHGNPGTPCDACGERARAEDGGRSVFGGDTAGERKWVWLCADCAAGF